MGSRSMEQKLSSVAKMQTSSPIQQLSYLAQRCNAVNLAEGFLDFPAPSCLKEAAIFAIRTDYNQYRHVQAICDYLAYQLKQMHGLDVDPLAYQLKQMHGLDVDPLTAIVLCCGQYVPILTIVAGADLKTASCFSVFMVTGGSIANVISNMFVRSPKMGQSFD